MKKDEEDYYDQDYFSSERSKLTKKKEKGKKIASGLSDLSDILTKGNGESNEAESTLESIANIVDGIATIKRIHDNRKKAGLETETDSGEKVAEIQFKLYDEITGDFYKYLESDSGIKRNSYLEQLNPKDPRESLMKHNAAVNFYNSDVEEVETFFSKLIKQRPTQETKVQEQLATTKLEKNDPSNQSNITSTATQTGGTDQFNPPKTDINKPDTLNEKLENNKETEINVEEDTKTIFEENIIDDDDKKRGLGSLLGNFGRRNV